MNQIDINENKGNELQQGNFKENRIFQRFETNCPAKYKNASDYTEGEVFLRNASAQGLSFVSQDSFYVNDFISFAIDVPHSEIPLNVRGEIVWAKKDNENFWDIGVKLQQTRFVAMSRLYNDA